MSDRLPQLIADFKARGLAHYLRGENDERALLAGYTVRPELGAAACRFMEKYLRHSTGQWAGQPFRLLDWQRDRVVMPLFSWVRPGDDGNWIRRFRRVQIWVPVKNGKSELSAALCLTVWQFEEEPSFQGYLAANDRDQASIVYGQMAEMVNSSPQLSMRLKLLESKKLIRETTNSFVRVLSSEASGAEGWNAQYVGIDEIHKFDARGRVLREALRNRGAGRRQPVEVIISTAGDEEGIGHEEYQYAKAVEQGESSGGVTDITLLPVIFEAKADCDIADPEAHRAANPSYGHIIRPEEIAQEAAVAKNNPRMLSTFKRYRLNIWTGSETPWLLGERWKQLGGPLDEDELKRLPCFGGLDLSSTTDLTAWVLIWKRPDDSYIIRPRFWLPLDRIDEREAEDRTPYRQYQSQGWITLTPSAEIDFLAVCDQIGADYAAYKVHQIGFDAYLSNTLLPVMRDRHRISNASDEKRPGAERGLVKIPQTTVYLSEASKLLEAMVNATGKIRHDGNPIMARHVVNCRAYSDTNGNIRPIKCDRARRRMRIDGVAALVNGLARAMVCRPKPAGLQFVSLKA